MDRGVWQATVHGVTESNPNEHAYTQRINSFSSVRLAKKISSFAPCLGWGKKSWLCLLKVNPIGDNQKLY